jgi:GGDEF domain-containing protein
VIGDQDQLSVQDFSTRIKQKYPEYQDMDDNDLAQRIVAKYPEYQGVVAFSQPEKPSLSPMSREQADTYMEQLATRGMGPWQPVKPPSFADTSLVDPESSVFGQPIPSSIHPDTRGGHNLVPVQDVAAVRQQMKYEAAHPDEMAQVQRSQQMDTSLPFGERLTARTPLYARTQIEKTQRLNQVNEQWKQFAGEQGANAAEALLRFGGRNFQDDPNPTPGELGVARSVGKNVITFAADPVNQAMALLPLGAAGKAGQATTSALFAADMAKGSYDAAGQLGSIWDRPDISRQQKVEMGTDLVFNTIMAGMAGGHAIRAPFIHPADPHLSAIPDKDRALVVDQVNTRIANATPPAVPHPNPLYRPETSVTPSADETPIKEKVQAAVGSALASMPGTSRPVNNDGFSGLREEPAPSNQTTQQTQSAEEPSSDRRSASRGDDRRQDYDTRARIESLTAEQKDAEITDLRKERLSSKKTGLPNETAFKESEAVLNNSHPVIGYADIDDFKSLNTKMGHDALDQEILPTVGKTFQWAAAQENGDVHVFHRSGDEFLFRSANPDSFRRVIDRTNKKLQSVGVGLSSGLGDSTETAEASADLDKQNRKAAGLRVGSRDESQPFQTRSDVDNPSRGFAKHNYPSGILRKINPSPRPIRGRGTRKDLQAKYENYLDSHNSAATARRYSIALENFFSKLPANTNITEVQLSDLDNFARQRQAEGITERTITFELAAVRGFQNWVAEQRGRKPDVSKNKKVIPQSQPSAEARPSTDRRRLSLDDLRANLKKRFPEIPSTENPGPKQIVTPTPDEGKPAPSKLIPEQGPDFSQPEKPSPLSEDVPPQMSPGKARSIAESKAKWTPEKLAALRESRNHSEDLLAKNLENPVHPTDRDTENPLAHYGQLEDKLDLPSKSPENQVTPTERPTEDTLAQYGTISSHIRQLEAKLDHARRAKEKGFRWGGSLSLEQMADLEQQIRSFKYHANNLFKEHVRGLTDEEAQFLIEGIEKPAYKEIGQALQLHKLLKHDPIAKSLKQALVEDVLQTGLSLKSRELVRKILGDQSVGVRLTKGPKGQRTRIYEKLGRIDSPGQSFKLLKYAPKGPGAQELWDRIEMARNVARATLENETDPKNKNFLNRILETYPNDFIHDGVVIAKKGEYKYNPILVNPKIKGAASISTSEFFNAHLPGEIHEMSANNLAAILGKSKLSSKTGQLTPEQKSILKNTESDEERRMYRAQLVRDRVEQLRDDFVESTKKRVQQIKAIKEIRGIPADHLTPLETKLAAISDAQRRDAAPPKLAGLLEGYKGFPTDGGSKARTISTANRPSASAPESHSPQPKKPSNIPEGSQTERAVTPALSPVESVLHQRAQNLEKAILKLDNKFGPGLSQLRSAAEEIGKTRVDKYRLYEKGLKTYQKALSKDDPWALRRAVEAIRRPGEIGTVGPSARNLTPAEIKETNRAYLHRVLSKYEGLSDLRLAAFRDGLDDITMRRLLDESDDPAMSARYAKLVSKSESRDPGMEMGDRIVNGIRITAGQAAGDIIRESQGSYKWGYAAQKQALDSFISRFNNMSIGQSVDWQDAAEKGNWSFFTDPQELQAAKITNKKWAEYGQKLVDVGALDTYKLENPTCVPANVYPLLLGFLLRQ